MTSQQQEALNRPASSMPAGEYQFAALEKLNAKMSAHSMLDDRVRSEKYEPEHSKSYHHIVKHDYIDHGSTLGIALREPETKGGVAVAFPIKLYEMLDKIEEDGLADVVSWQPHGRCFLVHKPKEFTDHVMPIYFKMSKFPSFLRQLNLYSFRRITRGGLDKGAYYHELFLRGKQSLVRRIPRMRIKGNGVRARSNPENEPDFYSMPPILSDEDTASLSQDDPLLSSLVNMPLPRLPPPSTPASSGDFSMKNTLSMDEELDFAGRRFHSVSLDPFKSSSHPDDDMGKDEEEEDDDDVFSTIGDEVTFVRRLGILKETYQDICDNISNDTEFGFLLERLMSSLGSHGE